MLFFAIIIILAYLQGNGKLRSLISQMKRFLKNNGGTCKASVVKYKEVDTDNRDKVKNYLKRMI
ncbi:hypothetical protein RU92_GL001764 [Lactococcus cremoris subsp. tructae]|nr:hypothetical protein RU92_GL001764 [Lactococcus cremoris subsp. tructae]BBC74701.1 hypothetical protein LLCC_0268 [Lactococcus cremoris]BCO03369.1 hypothetical protein LLG32_14630 [Lactococcus cremoris]BCO06221.1 hypothetical protein LLC_14610 [Lactococcus cremoris]BDE08570.1 hypothetical protein Llc71_02650 [Lactococcus cremoris]